MEKVYIFYVDAVNKIYGVSYDIIYVMDTSGDRLKRARMDAGFKSARKAALRHGWNPSTYASHENGQTPVPVQAAKNYAKAFKVSASWIVIGMPEIKATYQLSSASMSLGIEGIDARLHQIDDEISRLQKEHDELLIAKQVFERFLHKP